MAVSSNNLLVLVAGLAGKAAACRSILARAYEVRAATVQQLQEAVTGAAYAWHARKTWRRGWRRRECALFENWSSLDSYGSSFSASAIWTRQQGVEPEPQRRMRSEEAMVAMGRCWTADLLCRQWRWSGCDHGGTMVVKPGPDRLREASFRGRTGGASDRR